MFYMFQFTFYSRRNFILPYKICHLPATLLMKINVLDMCNKDPHPYTSIRESHPRAHFLIYASH